jgi:DNA-binding NtrC family response regulator
MESRSSTFTQSRRAPNADAETMTQILLVGPDAPLLEGLAQSLAALGHVPAVALTLHDAREVASQNPPLVALVSRTFAAEASSEMLGIPLSPGGALVLYHTIGVQTLALPPALQRVVLADLTLPLERNRLVALVAHVQDRARAAGRGRVSGSTEQLEA